MTAGSPPDQLLRLWRQGAFELIASPALLAEFVSVIERPSVARYIRSSHERGRALRAELEAATVMVDPVGEMPATSRDPTEDLILHAAVEGQAEFIVTGDDDLLVLEELNGVPIVTPARFLAHLKASSE